MSIFDAFVFSNNLIQIVWFSLIVYGLLFSLALHIQLLSPIQRWLFMFFLFLLALHIPVSGYYYLMGLPIPGY